MSRAASPRRRTPREAKTFEAICALRRDGADFPTWWLQLDPEVIVVVQQQKGQPSTGTVTMPRAEWDAALAWYATGKMPRPRAKRGRA